MKICTKCGESKPLSEFYNRTSGKGGKNPRCKTCIKDVCKAWYSENREKAIESARLWAENNKNQRQLSRKRYYLENKEWFNEKSKRWHHENKDAAKANSKAWRERNREKHLLGNEKWRRENTERHKANSRLWYSKNKDCVIARNRSHYHQTKHLSKFKSKHILKRMLRNFLVSAQKSKDGRTHELLGYSSTQLLEHLERQFLKGMSWDNYGTEWHVDHIISVAEHVRNGETSPAVVNCLTNLRPYWAKDNIRKSDKRTHLI